MLRGNEPLSIIIQLGNGGLLGLQTFTDEVLLRQDRLLYLLVCTDAHFVPAACVSTPFSYLVLPLAGRIVQVGVAPVVVNPLLSLLVHPVQLIGAALHIVPQAQQVTLASSGTGLTK